jgi:uncharacterized OB-fold protein
VHGRAGLDPDERHDLEEDLMTTVGRTDKPFKNMPPPILADPMADERIQPFWDATKDERLLAPKCASCGTFRMPPVRFCAKCLSQELAWEPLPGTGTVYTFIIVRHPLNPNAANYVPYMPAAIEADGAPGIRFISNVVECEPEDVKIGMKVRVVWNHVSDALTLPFWIPA